MAKKYLVVFVILAFQVLNPAFVYGDAKFLELYSQEIENEITSQIELLNEIIQDPQAASMENWARLQNPHDESELMFYMNSISNGTAAVYQEGSSTQERLIKHSRTISKTEESVVLRYLRLSLMAFDIRPGYVSPEIRISNISPLRPDSNEVIAEGNLMVHDASGKRVQLSCKIIFVIETEKHEIRAYLQKIIVRDKEIYGWWHQI